MIVFPKTNDSQNPDWQFISTNEKPLASEFKTEGIFTVVLQGVKAKSWGKDS